MALGHRDNRRIPLPFFTGSAHDRAAFYQRLEHTLQAAHFDARVESLCRPYYARRGRPSLPPGMYFRMLLIGFFEDARSQRRLSRDCDRDATFRQFLALDPSASAPNHSTLTVIRRRLPRELHRQVFAWIAQLAGEAGMLRDPAQGDELMRFWSVPSRQESASCEGLNVSA